MYITVQNVINGLGRDQVTRWLDISPNSTDMEIESNPVLLQKIDAANGQIESYVRNKITTPLVTVPGQFIEHGVSLVNWFLGSYRPDAVLNETDVLRYNNAMRYFRDIAEGVGGIDVGDNIGYKSGAKVAPIGNRANYRNSGSIKILTGCGCGGCGCDCHCGPPVCPDSRI